MRLDKYLCDNLDYSRSDIKKFIKQGLVCIDSKVVKDPSCKVEEGEQVTYNGQLIEYSEYRLFCLNKPAGYITANDDKNNKYVLQLISEPNKDRLFAIGRLDKDTTGLLLITDDGKFAHDMISPSKHVDKTYLVETEHKLTEDNISALENGLDIGDDKPTKPAKVNVIDDKYIELTITEGRYHQVKRMLEAINNKVLSLKRLRFGNLALPDDLKEGEYITVRKEDIC